MLQAVSAAPYDVLAAPPEQVRSLLAWLKTLAEPGKEEAVLLTESEMKSANRFYPPALSFAWSGYAWKTQCHLLGDVLLALGPATNPGVGNLILPLVGCGRADRISGVASC